MTASEKGPSVPERRCPKARLRGQSGRADQRVEHAPHEWWAGAYLPVGDLGFAAVCPGYAPTTKGSTP